MSAKTKGRPRKEIDQALLDAAANEFLEYGYTDANVGRIAAAGNSTKPALYRRYPSKEHLFEAVLTHVAKDFELDMSFLDKGRPVEQVLYELAELFYNLIGSPRVMALSRLGAQESARFPQLIFHFREQVMSGFIDEVMEYFAYLDAERVVRIPNTLEAAIIFTTLAGRSHERMMGVRIADDEVEPHLRELVRFFLSGYAPR
jgi:TetR/AcrR family transcriptional repressor of mexJK operon